MADGTSEESKWLIAYGTRRSLFVLSPDISPFLLSAIRYQLSALSSWRVLNA
jgi:hypothetical protein